MKIKLVNMPFADANRPSLSLTQLRTRVVALPMVSSCDIVYVNQDATLYFGQELFEAISQQYTAGLGDWLFRHLAFPHASANANAYFARHFPYQDAKSQAIKQTLLERRDGLDSFLEKMVEKYQLADADLVGFSSMFSQNVASFALCNLLKKRKPDIVTVIGGANCESPMGQEIARHVHGIDFVFSGPSLISFPELVEKYFSGNKEACHSISGVFSRKNVDKPGAVGLAGKELPIDTHLPLDFESFLNSFDTLFPAARSAKKLTFETSRGCWWGQRSHCTFCGLNSQGMFYRSMAPEVARAKLEEILAYAPRVKHFSCVDNIMPQDFTSKVLPGLEVPENVEIFYEIKADMSDEQIALMAEKRITRVQPGIEALYTKTLKLMRKGTTSFGNVRFLKSCARHDVFPEWNLLVGFPGEGEDAYQFYLANLPLLVHLPPPGGCYPVRFDRYSPYFTKADEYELKLSPYDFYKDVYPFPGSALNNMAYYFQDSNFRAEYSRVMIKHIDTLRTIVGHWNNSWHHHRPRLEWQSPTSIIDTRFGKSQEHFPSAEEIAILQALETRKAPSSLAKSIEILADVNVEKILKDLAEKGLVFCESGRYISLVIEPV